MLWILAVLVVSMLAGMVIGHILHDAFDRYTVEDRRTHCCLCGGLYPSANRFCLPCELVGEPEPEGCDECEIDRCNRCGQRDDHDTTQCPY